ncbi:ferredoxin reductase [Labrys sp. WJW]|uniref:NAD(P)/FAD-dependent oxidoreductase n=1 Tax=Labrys sp. WJW TaxID=1737983 RepID=UPI0008322668|nr:FAD-dependent oxidoreductase [Labrys sp. WJW]OCC06939.1 ferredoxin reductase [Labrys sp. WJW]
MSEHMVIIGAGEAGCRAAFALRELGFTGSVTLIGEEVHLPYERPPLSKDALTGEAAPGPKTIATAARFEASAITCLTGIKVQGIDRMARQVYLSDGRSLAYHRLLLATGAHARRIALPGDAVHHCVTLRRFEDLERLRSHFRPGAKIAIIGGGFIGLELAASAIQRGAGVTLIEVQQRILSRGVPEEIARMVEARHLAAGVQLVCGIPILSLQDRGRQVVLRLANGQEIVADLVVAGVGAVPATELAEATGLAIENGIAVDARLRTSDPSIFAGGDCCSFPLPVYDNRRVRLESWRNAQDHGALAARNMLGADDAISAVPWFWSDQYDLSLQVAGLVDQGCSLVRRDLGPNAVLQFHLDESGRLVAASGIGPGNAVARDIRLAEMLIARRARPSVDALSTPKVNLKSLLAA